MYNIDMKKAPTFYSVLLLILFIFLFFSTCKKEYSYEGGPVTGTASGTAVYTFTSSAGSCTGNLITGNYFSGNPLDASNTVELEVNVTSIGNYKISTGSVNGFSFSASGDFITTGIQKILLIGQGTPAAAGNFNFATPVNPGCTFSVHVTAAPIALAVYTLQGDPTTCQSFAAKGTYIAGTTLDIANTVDVIVNVSAKGIYTLSTDTLDGISFSKSGTFTNTGIQTVTLTGNGTPQFPRDLIFTPQTGTSSCSFPLTISNAAPLATYVLESGFGTPSPCTFTVQGNYVNNIALANTNTVTIKTFVTVAGNFTIATNIVNGMMFSYTGTFSSTGTQFVTLAGSGTPTAAGIFSFIPTIVGPHPLGGESCGFTVTVN